MRVSAGRNLGRAARLPRSRASSSGATSAITSSQPRTSNASNVGQPAGRRQAPAGDDGDAAAEGLRVGEDVRAEEDRAALIAQLEDQRADVAAAERIEPGHRLVEEDHLGIVDERLRDADALHHPLRELAQLQPAFGADADAIEQRRHPRLRSAAR